MIFQKNNHSQWNRLRRSQEDSFVCTVTIRIRIYPDPSFMGKEDGTLSVFYVHIYRHASTLKFLGANSGNFVKGGVQQGKQKEY